MTQLKKFSITCAILTGASLCAQETPARNQDYAIFRVLPEHVVVANTYEVPLIEVGSSVELIEREDLVFGQSTFALDAIRDLPGVYVRNNGGPGSSFGITVRGLNSNRPLVLLDGIEVSDPTSGFIINPGLLFTDSVERIEFLKGPQSSLYGADALGGVINIQSRQVADGESAGSLSAAYGTYNTRQGSLTWQTRQGPVDVSMSLARQEQDGYSVQDGNNEDDGYENTGVRAKIGYRATQTLALYATAYYIDAESEFDNTSTDPVGLAVSEQLFAKIGGILQATEDWQSRLGLAYTNVKSESITASVFETEGDRYKLDWKNTIALSETWKIAAGAEHEIEDNRTNAGDRDNTSVYIDNSLEIIPNVFWTLGGRLDDSSAYGSNETWRTTISYVIDSINSRIHGSFGTSFQAPTFFQTLNPTFGTPDLAPEKGKGWDVGVESKFFDEKLVLDVTAFGNEVDDKIDFDFGTFTFMNSEYYESKGIETSLNWQILEGLSIQTNYTYTQAEYDDGTEAERVPEDIANLSILWTTCDDRLDLKASIIYVGEQKTFRSSTEKQDDYSILNLAGQYAINDRLTIWTSVNNVLNAEYQEIEGFNSPDFNILAGIRIQF